MRLGIRLPLLALSIYLGSTLSAWAMDLRYGERVYLLPTSAEVVVPTSLVTSDSYLVPSAFVVPTARYYPTALVADSVVLSPTSYVETVRYRRGLIGSVGSFLFGSRRLAERSVIASYPTAYVPTTSIYPTSFYSVASEVVPTVFDRTVAWSGAAAAADSCCAEVVSSYGVPSSPAPTINEYASPPAASSRRVESNSAMDDSSIPSYVKPAPPNDPTPADLEPADDAAASRSQIPGRGQESSSPPQPPAPKPPPEKGAATGSQPTLEGAARDADTTKDAGKAVKESRPAAPKAPSGDAGDSGLEASPGTSSLGASRRVVGKPVYTPAVRPERRNVLFGKIESSVSGQPEEEVRVIVSSRTNRGIQHEGMSDAYGRFAIKLADGDWTVSVTMPSRRVYPVSQITVVDGRIIDQREGREVPSLIITR